jgi:hypothetical protein
MWFWIHNPVPSQTTDPKGWRKSHEARVQAIKEIQCHLSPELRSVSLGSSDPQSILNAIKEAHGTSCKEVFFNLFLIY